MRQKSRCFAALTMIKKALPAAFPSMPQDDRIAVQLAGVLWTIAWKTQGLPGAFLWGWLPAGLAGLQFSGRLTVSGVAGLKRQFIQAEVPGRGTQSNE
jgi:hypothetical protein